MLCAELFDAGCTGIEETGAGLVAYFDESIQLSGVQHLLKDLTHAVKDVPVVTVLEAKDRDPILIGSRFVLVPADRIVLPIDAAMAFGSGRHESTQLCLEALAASLQSGQTVYDVGCGSGILSLAAQKLGAARVVAADSDEASIAVAQRHFTGPLFVGSADGFPPQSADILLCNITGPVLDRIAADLKRIAKPEGVLIISGFTGQTAPRCFTPMRKLVLDDWQCWICKPEYIDPTGTEASLDSEGKPWWI